MWERSIRATHTSSLSSLYHFLWLLCSKYDKSLTLRVLADDCSLLSCVKYPLLHGRRWCVPYACVTCKSEFNYPLSPGTATPSGFTCISCALSSESTQRYVHNFQTICLLPTRVHCTRLHVSSMITFPNTTYNITFSEGSLAYLLEAHPGSL